MSEDIEELVNNLNSSLTYAIKTTLGPYVQKLNMNNEKYKVVTNILKSLPEYKEMEKDILQFNNEKQNLLHQFNSEKQNLLDQFHNEKQTLLQRLHEVITHNLSLQKEIDTKNASNEKINVGLNVIEKESPADEVVDVVDKVKDIYSQANIKVINNIVAPVPALRVVTLPVVTTATATAISRDAEIEELISVLEKHLEKEEDASEVEEDASEVDEEASEVDEAEQKKVVIVTSAAAAVVVDEDEEASEVEESDAEQKKVVIVTSAADEEEVDEAEDEVVEEDEVVADEEEEEELFAINIVGFKNEFYTSDKLNGDIYEVNSDDSVGKMLGKFKNGTPVWNK